MELVASCSRTREPRWEGRPILNYSLTVFPVVCTHSCSHPSRWSPTTACWPPLPTNWGETSRRVTRSRSVNASFMNRNAENPSQFALVGGNNGEISPTVLGWFIVWLIAHATACGSDLHIGYSSHPRRVQWPLLGLWYDGCGTTWALLNPQQR